MRFGVLFILFIFLILIVFTSSCGNDNLIIVVDNNNDNTNNDITLTSQLPTCSQSNGFECKYDEYCPSNFLNVSDSNNCCATQCTKYQKTNTCNYNTINEDWEDISCKDAQCQGTVCGGLCYNTEGICNDGKFIFGECIGCNNKDIDVEFDIPSIYKANQIENGRIIFTNNLDEQINLGLGWGYDDLFEIKTSSGNDLLNEFQISLMSKENKIIPITIVPKRNYNLLLRSWEIFSNVKISTLDAYGDARNFSSHYMRVFPYNAITSCGGNQFGVDGVCVNNILYPEMECDGKETNTVKDYYGLCANGFSFKNRIAYDENTKNFQIKEPTTLNDVKAIGNKKVFITRLNNNVDLDIDSMERWVETFYDSQSQKITGRNLVDFSFEDRGSISFDWNKINESSRKVKIEFRNELENQLNINSNQYDMLVAFTNKSNSKILFNESTGRYLSGSRVILMDMNYSDSYNLVAHEIGHSFGAPDLYLDNTYPLVCGYHFINDIMCGASILFASESNLPPEDFKFYTSPFIGWGDIDGDGILDVEDDNIFKIPSWLQGIEILDVHPSIASRGTQNEQFNVTVYVIDKKTQKLMPSVITITANNVSVPIYSSTGQISNIFTAVPTTPIDITVTAEYGTFRDVKTITFDLNNYTYRKSKYDPSIHNP